MHYGSWHVFSFIVVKKYLNLFNISGFLVIFDLMGIDSCHIVISESAPLYQVSRI